MYVYKLKQQEQGFSLFVVLIIMLVIAFLVIAGAQSVNTETRMSSNDADRKYALSLAETALRAGENRLSTLAQGTTFSVTCPDALCVPAGGVALPDTTNPERFSVSSSERIGNCTALGCSNIAWERAAANGQAFLNSGNNSIEVDASDAAKKPRYIIEYLNNDSQNRYFFRVTARAWGKNDNTVVTVQSYVEVSYQ